MKRGSLSEYFVGVTAKRISAGEADQNSSNQHEFNGVMELKTLLGKDKMRNHPARFIWFGNENEGFSEDSFVTWYDSRKNHPVRSEYRLYFKGNAVMEFAAEGDLLVVAKRPSDDLLIIVAEKNSTVENQLIWLFGVSQENIGAGFEYKDFDAEETEVDFAARFILEELGIEVEEQEADRLDKFLEPKPFYKNMVFPTTAEFSAFARGTLDDISPRDNPDRALLAWMEREEKLFKRLERHVVAERLQTGFWSDVGPDVDDFIRFSLSVQNRRKSRTGYALEHHLDKLFQSFKLKYTRQARTENAVRADFLFPGADAYHDPEFSAESLSLLGVKSTCKDRWRQVLSEAKRIPDKHLLTLEPGISAKQTDEMRAHKLRLVLPEKLHETYRESQRSGLMSVQEFISHVSAQQS